MAQPAKKRTAMPAKTKKKYSKAASIEWFTSFVRNSFSLRKEIMKGDNGRLYRNSAAIGRLYSFYYNAKYRDTLPVWDRFPLVFPIEFYPGGKMLGLNLHYLSVGQRDKLIGMLMRYANNPYMDETTRLQLSWKAVTATATMKGLSKRCVKMYLRSHIVSRFVEIPINDWEKIITLPTEVWEYN